MDVKISTLLNATQRLEGFVYEHTRLCGGLGGLRIEVDVRAHKQRAARCSKCQCLAPGYDHLELRDWLGIPMWGIDVWLRYAPRRVTCPTHGVIVEHMPWNEGKNTLTVAMMVFLAQWARRLSIKEVGVVFRVGWHRVFQAVDWVVQWGLEHRTLAGIVGIGIDELHWGKGQRNKAYVTLIYQVDKCQRRVLGIVRGHAQKDLRRGLRRLGTEALASVRYVCSDMWKAYLKVIPQWFSGAVHMIDRFHVTQLLNQAVDKVRRTDMAAMKGRPQAKRIKGLRWTILRRFSRVRGRARQALTRMMSTRLATGRAWQLKEAFLHFWSYRSTRCAREFLRAWVSRAKRSRIGPMQKFAATLQRHEPMLLNWIQARDEIMTGAVEGLNNKCRVVTRRAYGYRSFAVLEVMLYHTLGKLPMPELAHKF
jgi:transposase